MSKDLVLNMFHVIWKSYHRIWEGGLKCQHTIQMIKRQYAELIYKEDHANLFNTIFLKEKLEIQ